MRGPFQSKSNFLSFGLLIFLAITHINSTAHALACPSELKQTLNDQDIIVYSPKNDFKIITSHNKNISINRDSPIYVSYVMKDRDRLPFRAIALLRQTTPRIGYYANTDITISNNIWRLLNFLRKNASINTNIFINHHNRTSISQTILGRFHVPYPNSITDSFHTIQNPDVFLGFFNDQSKNYWARIQRYRGLSNNINCATFVLYHETPPPTNVIDSAKFRIVYLSENNNFAKYTDFEVLFND